MTKTNFSQAACAVPTTDYGSATQTLDITTSGTYRIWSRIQAPDTTNNSYFLEIDGGSCITVGDNSIPANTWTWVDYQSSTTTSKINATLSSGNHTFKMIGREPGVKLDRIVLTTDTSCVPVGFGTNCSNPPDTTPPTVNLTSPANGSSVSGTTTLSATATDDVGVTKVEFLVDSVIVNTDTSSPYSYNWNSTTVLDGTRTITAKAHDSANNYTTSTAINVTVSNSPPPPNKPGDINGDSKVDVFDLSILATNFGKNGMTLAQGDLNNDGVVNVFDLSILAANWGK